MGHPNCAVLEERTLSAGNKLPEGLLEDVKAAVKEVEENMGKKYGDAVDPLLFSVRSGAAV
eukprot:scaffold76464_cov13-Tisochrysis_lutea.AAC.1